MLKKIDECKGQLSKILFLFLKADKYTFTTTPKLGDDKDIIK